VGLNQRPGLRKKPKKLDLQPLSNGKWTTTMKPRARRKRPRSELQDHLTRQQQQVKPELHRREQLGLPAQNDRVHERLLKSPSQDPRTNARPTADGERGKHFHSVGSLQVLNYDVASTYTQDYHRVPARSSRRFEHVTPSSKDFKRTEYLAVVPLHPWRR
jgi:hypothetical protein